MSRELLLGLVTEVDRLLAAGVAGGGGGLARQARGLRELARKVSALATLAAAVERFTAAPASPTAFLDLLVLSRQVRAGLSAAGAEGALEAPPPGGPWRTPATPGDVLTLYEALTGRGGKWADLWPGAVERGTVGNLRLLPALLGALARAGELGEAAAGQGLPAFGPAVLPELTERLDLRGKSADARRLLAVCKADARRGAELCREALARGSTPLRVQALECLPEVGGPGEAEEAGLPFCHDKNPELRAAAYRALRGARGDEALDALVRALDEEGVGAPWHAAQWALERLPHPRATARLAREIETRVAALPAPPPPHLKAPDATADPGSSLQLGRIARFVEALSLRKDDPETAVGALLPLTRHPDRRLQWDGLRGLGLARAATPEALAAFKAALTDLKQEVAPVAVAALGLLPPEKRESLIPHVLDLLGRRVLLKEIVHPAADLLPAHTARYGERIVQSFRGLLGHEDWHVRHAALEAVRKVGPAAGALLPDLLRWLRKYEGRPSFYHVFVAVDPEGGRAVPALVRLLADAKVPLRCAVLQALAGYGTKAHAARAEVEKLLTDGSPVVRTHAEVTLQAVRTE
jgi:HEAT repeat protein